MKNLYFLFLSIILISCNDKQEKDGLNEDFVFYNLNGGESVPINIGNPLKTKFYTDSVYFNDMKFDFHTRKIKDTLKSEDSIIIYSKFIFTQSFDLEEPLPIDFTKYDIDKNMDIFIVDEENDKAPYFLEFKKVGVKKQVFLIFENLVFTQNNDSLRQIQYYSVYMDTIQVLKR